MTQDERLIDLIHGAALDPALWVPVMEQVADAVGGHGATLARLNMLDGSGDAILARSDPATLDSYAAHFQSRNVLTVVEDPASYRAGATSGVATDEAALPRDAFLRSEFYNDFLRPQGIDSALWIRLELAEREVCTITIGRSARKGRYGAADIEAARLLQPHLVRAYKMSRNLAASRDLGLAMDQARHAAFLLDRDGRLRHANTLAAALLAAGKALSVSAGRLLAANSAANAQLQALIAAGLHGQPRSGGAMALPTPAGRLPLALRTAPLGRGSPVFGTGGGLLVTVADLDAQVQSPAEDLRLLFGLTAAEARIAGAIYEGMSLPEAAQAFGLSGHTVRFQLARVFDKTGVTRQTELVKLMIRLETARQPPGGLS